MEEAARTTYEAARQEVLYRMRLRDHALLVYIAFVGAILGVVFNNDKLTLFANGEALLSIPFLALGVSILVSQHYMMAAAIGQFCTNELAISVEKFAPQWDNSKTFKKHADTSSNFRVISHMSLILIPCAFALVTNLGHAIGDFPFILAWWFGFACSVGSYFTIQYADTKRKEMYKNRKWEEE